MNSQEYEQWWKLHLRVASGDALSSSEELTYQAGRLVLEQEEKEPLRSNLLSQLLNLRQRIEELNAQHGRLATENSQLDKKIKKLEKVYQTLTGYQLH